MGGGRQEDEGIISLNITLFTECMCCAFVMVFQTALFLTFYMLGSCFRTLAEILVSVLSIFCLRLYGERVIMQVCTHSCTQGATLDLYIL